jgi:hypothetical protein
MRLQGLHVVADQFRNWGLAQSVFIFHSLYFAVGLVPTSRQGPHLIFDRKGLSWSGCWN